MWKCDTVPEGFVDNFTWSLMEGEALLSYFGLSGLPAGFGKEILKVVVNKSNQIVSKFPLKITSTPSESSRSLSWDHRQVASCRVGGENCKQLCDVLACQRGANSRRNDFQHFVKRQHAWWNVSVGATRPQRGNAKVAMRRRMLAKESSMSCVELQTPPHCCHYKPFMKCHGSR